MYRCVQDPLRFVPGIAGSQNLMPLYNNITQAIRAVDSHHMVFYEVRAAALCRPVVH
jgi:hypothetical protein